jgi:hypothetical protein
MSVPNDPYFAEQWHLENTGMGIEHVAGRGHPRAGGVGDLDGARALIANIDTGVDLGHPDLHVIAGTTTSTTTTIRLRAGMGRRAWHRHFRTGCRDRQQRGSA